MREKIVVMGVGKLFKKYKEKIYKRYEVIGVTSNNAMEAEFFPDYIPLSQINHFHYDYILVCCSKEVEIVNQLIGEKIVEKNRILLATVVFREKGDIFYAQYKEDIMVCLLLKLIGLNYSEVTYLDLGANHPINLSNTYSLYLLGASGVLVEPNKDLKNVIEIVRPKDIFVNKAVSLDGKPAKFYSLSARELGTLSYEKLDKEYCKQYENFDIEKTYMVETVTINDIFHKMRKIPEVFSIDIEGYDYAILSQINYEKYRPIIMIVELVAWGAKEQEGNKIKDLLCGNGYGIFYQNGVNAIFIDKKYADVVEEYAI